MRIRTTEIGLVLLSVILLSTMSSMVLAAKATNKIQGQGWIADKGYHNTFHVRIAVTDDVPEGKVTYHDRGGSFHGGPYKLESYEITQVVIYPQGGGVFRAVIWGKATVNGEKGYEFQIQVLDSGPSKEIEETLSIGIKYPESEDYYDFERDYAVLGGGNIKIS